MDLEQGMAETVVSKLPSAAELAACTGLSDEELAVYSTEYSQTGFQGACSGIAARQRAWTALRSNCSSAALSMCRPCSLLARVTGECISVLATSSSCRPAPARTCEAVICW